MKIRKAINKDLKKISEIFRTEYRKPPYNENWSEKNSLIKIKEYFKGNYIFVLELKKKIIGFVIFHTFFWYDGKRGLIDEMVISSEHQGRGLGKKLMVYMENFLDRKNVKKICLMSLKTSKAFKIYERMGFKEKNLVLMVKKCK